MLKKLRRKILLSNMLLVSAVLLIAMTAVLYFSVDAALQEFYDSLSKELRLDFFNETPPTLHLGEQEDPPIHHAEIPHIRAFLRSDDTWEVYHGPNIQVANDSLVKALTRIQENDRSSGLFMDLHMGYVSRDASNGTMVILGDSSTVRIAFHDALQFCLLISVSSLLILFLVSLFLSDMAIRPVAQAWRQQKQFIADASHELKTPLTVILANTRIISDHPDAPVSQQTQWLSSTREEAEQMRRLLDEMLTLARADADHGSFTPVPTNISELVEAELLYLEPVAYEKNTELIANIAPGLVIPADPPLVKKLLVILVDNAIKYGSSGTPVTITLSGRKTICLSVHNHGQAIAPEDLPHLFDRFYRTDRSRSTEGYGLGLPIAHAIMTKMGGTLSVASSEVYGTTFTAEFKK